MIFFSLNFFYREEYQLVCSDSEGYSAIDGIEVSTLSRPFYEKFNVLFVFVFNDTLDDGARLARSRVKLMSRIARIFRDSDTSQIVLNKVNIVICILLISYSYPPNHLVISRPHNLKSP